MGLKKETLLEDMKTNNKIYRKVSVKLQYDEIKLLENYSLYTNHNFYNFSSLLI